jgi:2-oxoglutarate/2-oxoacid ferredoxin oxidoreductase subunit alpha
MDEERILSLAKKVKSIVVPELNAGQIVREIQRISLGNCNVISVPHYGGTVHHVEDILDAIKKGVNFE